MRALRLLALFALLPFVMTGCDPAGGDLFSFDVTGLRFTFEFDGNAVNSGAAQIPASNLQNIQARIEQQGFSMSDVVSVRLVDGSGQIRILNAPAGTDIGFLDAVSLRLTSGSSAVEVASQDDFGSMTGTMSGEAELDVLNTNIASTTTAGDFGATLDVQAAAAQSGVSYRLETRFDVTVEVETL